MTPPVEGVVTNAWPYVIASYGLLWVSLAAYGGWFGRVASTSREPASDRITRVAIAVGALWIVFGIAIAGYDYAMDLRLPKAVLYAWATPGILAVSYGVVRQTP